MSPNIVTAVLEILNLWHNQGNAGAQPNACHGLYAEPADLCLSVFHISGKPKAGKLVL